MRRQDRDELEARDAADALKCMCAACHAKADDPCVDTEGRPRKPHKVRLSVGRWAAAKARAACR